MEEKIKAAKSILNEISNEVDNNYIKSTLNIVNMKLDTILNTEMSDEEIKQYCDKMVHYEISNMKHIVPPLPEEEINKLDSLGNVILSIRE